MNTKDDLIALWNEYIGWRNKIIEEDVKSGAPMPTNWTTTFVDFMDWLQNQQN